MSERTFQFNQWVRQPIHWIAILSGLLPLVFLAVYMFTNQLNLPRIDQFRSVEIASHVADGDFQVRDLVLEYAGHISVFNQLLTASQVLLTRWNLNVEMFVNLLLGCIDLAILLALYWRTHPASFSWVLLPISALVFSIQQDINWLSGYHGVWHWASTFFLLGLWLVTNFHHRWWGIPAAALMALCSTFTFGGGFITWGLLLVSLWLLGYRRWIVLALWCLAGVLSVWFYASLAEVSVQSAEAAGQHAGNPLFLADPLRLIHFTFAFIGNPFAIDQVELATLVGVIGVVLFLFNLRYLWRHGTDRIVYGIWLPVAGYGVGMGGLIALARAPDAVSGLRRAVIYWYITAAQFFWFAFAALTVMVVWEIAHNRQHLRRLRSFVNIHFVFFLLLFMFFVFNNFFVANVTGSGHRSTSEACADQFLLSRGHLCGGHVRGEYVVDQLAIRKLAMFAHKPALNILPDVYHEGQFVLVETNSAWWNVHIRDWLLVGVPPDYIVHLFPQSQELNEIGSYLPENYITQIDTPSVPRIVAQAHEWETFWYIRPANVPVSVLGSLLEADGYNATTYKYPQRNLLMTLYKRHA